MNYKSKYIIVKQGANIIPVVFGDLAAHNNVARGFMPAEIIGAGFCHFVEEDGPNSPAGYVCYGESTSLRIKSGDNDTKILNKYLGIQYK